ncbi:MAG: hypothetical protein HFG14_11755 [Lachnospiraceae bacterium]|jgi:hypothetical protein|nr:hypothetical protein [Lachnospiraceae bacterium]
MLGTELNVVAFLELILAVYSMALVFNSDKKVFKIVHAVLGVMWAVMALLNMFA